MTASNESQDESSHVGFNAARDTNDFPSDAPIDRSMGRDTFPGYEVVRELQKGAQGIVYQAIQLSTKRKVAVKVLDTGRFHGESDLARFEREIYILAQMRHPNIVRIFDSGRTATGAIFYVMDYIPGKTLDNWIKDHPNPPIAATLRMFVKLCTAVREVHLRAVIHRDIKPTNIKIAPDGDPILLDFGYARPVLGDLLDDHDVGDEAVPGVSLMSVPWSSPEQAEGSAFDVDVRTDVHALGLVLYHILTGRFPYGVTGGLAEVLRNIAGADPVPPSRIRSDINADLEAIILKCLRKRREERYQSAGRLAEDIEHYLKDEPISARPPSLWLQTRSFCRRNKPLVTTFAVAVAAIIATLVAVASAYVVAEGATKKAELSAKKANDALASEKRTVEFIKNTLTSASPYILGGQTPQTVEELLISTGNRLDTAYADDPKSRAEFALLLANTLYQMDQYRAAEDLYKKAITAADSARDRNERLLIEARAGLGWTYGNQSRIDEAMKYLEPARNDALLSLTIDDELFRRVCTYHARSLEVTQPAKIAIQQLERVVKEGERTHGPDNPGVLDLKLELGSLYPRAADTEGVDSIDTGRRILDDVFKRLDRTLGFGDARTQRAAIAIVKWCATYRPGDEGETLARRVIEARTQARGSGDLETLRAKDALVEILTARGKCGEAYDLARQIAQVRVEAIGSNRRDTMRARWLQLRAGIESRRMDRELADTAESSVRFSEQTFGAADADTYWCRAMLARINVELNRADEAARTLEGIQLEASKNNTSYVKDITPIIKAWHADALVRLDRASDAYAVLRDAHELALRRFGPQSPARRAMLDRLIEVSGRLKSADQSQWEKDKANLPQT